MVACKAFLKAKLLKLAKLDARLVIALLYYFAFLGAKTYEYKLVPERTVGAFLEGHTVAGILWIGFLILFLLPEFPCARLWRKVTFALAVVFQILGALSIWYKYARNDRKVDHADNIIASELIQTVSMLLAPALHVLLDDCLITSRERLAPPERQEDEENLASTLPADSS